MTTIFVVLGALTMFAVVVVSDILKHCVHRLETGQIKEPGPWSEALLKPKAIRDRIMTELLDDSKALVAIYDRLEAHGEVVVTIVLTKAKNA